MLGKLLRRLAALALLLVLAPAPAVADELSAARDAARLVLEARCGGCHIAEYPTAVPGALAVYNLSELEWAAHLTDLQRADILDRLRNPQGMDDVVKGPAEAKDIAAVLHYFELSAAKAP